MQDKTDDRLHADARLCAPCRSVAARHRNAGAGAAGRAIPNFGDGNRFLWQLRALDNLGFPELTPVERPLALPVATGPGFVPNRDAVGRAATLFSRCEKG